MVIIDTNIDFRNNFEAKINLLTKNNIKDHITIIFDDNTSLTVRCKVVIINLIFLRILRTWNTPITSDLFVDYDQLDTSSPRITQLLDKCCNNVYTAVRRRYPTNDISSIAFDINEAAACFLNNFILENCQSHQSTLSIIDLCKIANMPKVKEIVKDPIKHSFSISESVSVYNEKSDQLYQVLSSDISSDNALRYFMNLRLLNSTVLAHMFYQVGFRADVDNKTFRTPVVGNYVDGLKSLSDVCYDSVSAKRAGSVTTKAIPDADYFTRKLHLCASSITEIVHGDCGLAQPIPFFISPLFKDLCLYKNIIENGHIVTLDKSNIDNYVNKTVMMKSPMSCNYHDKTKICSACAGTLLSYLPPLHIGMYGAAKAGEKFVQKLLKTKHNQDSMLVDWTMPTAMDMMFERYHGGLRIKQIFGTKFNSSKLIFELSDIAQFLHLSKAQLVSLIKNPNDSLLGKCTQFTIVKRNGSLTDTFIFDQEQMLPMFSPELIYYIVMNQQYVEIKDNKLMVLMQKFNPSWPIFKLTAITQSTELFVASIRNFLQKKIRSYTSCTDVLNDFAALALADAKVNIAYIEMLLRSCIITNECDYRIPHIDNIDNVWFNGIVRICKYRSNGTLMALEGLPTVLLDPKIYLVPRQITPFDYLINIKPRGG